MSKRSTSNKEICQIDSTKTKRARFISRSSNVRQRTKIEWINRLRVRSLSSLAFKPLNLCALDEEQMPPDSIFPALVTSNALLPDKCLAAVDDEEWKRSKIPDLNRLTIKSLELPALFYVDMLMNDSNTVHSQHTTLCTGSAENPPFVKVRYFNNNKTNKIPCNTVDYYVNGSSFVFTPGMYRLHFACVRLHAKQTSLNSPHSECFFLGIEKLNSEGDAIRALEEGKMCNVPTRDHLPWFLHPNLSFSPLNNSFIVSQAKTNAKTNDKAAAVASLAHPVFSPDELQLLLKWFCCREFQMGRKVLHCSFSSAIQHYVPYQHPRFYRQRIKQPDPVFFVGSENFNAKERTYFHRHKIGKLLAFDDYCSATMTGKHGTMFEPWMEFLNHIDQPRQLAQYVIELEKQINELRRVRFPKVSSFAWSQLFRNNFPELPKSIFLERQVDKGWANMKFVRSPGQLFWTQAEQQTKQEVNDGNDVNDINDLDNLQDNPHCSSTESAESEAESLEASPSEAHAKPWRKRTRSTVSSEENDTADEYSTDSSVDPVGPNVDPVALEPRRSKRKIKKTFKALSMDILDWNEIADNSHEYDRFFSPEQIIETDSTMRVEKPTKSTLPALPEEICLEWCRNEEEKFRALGNLNYRFHKVTVRTIRDELRKCKDFEGYSICSSNVRDIFLRRTKYIVKNPYASSVYDQVLIHPWSKESDLDRLEQILATEFKEFRIDSDNINPGATATVNNSKLAENNQEKQNAENAQIVPSVFDGLSVDDIDKNRLKLNQEFEFEKSLSLWSQWKFDIQHIWGQVLHAHFPTKQFPILTNGEYSSSVQFFTCRPSAKHKPFHFISAPALALVQSPLTKCLLQDSQYEFEAMDESFYLVKRNTI